MSDTLAYVYELQKASYQSLSSLKFKIAVVDRDDAQLTSAQVNQLESTGKNIIGYLSIGEAENYRDYWQSSWNSSPPSFVLGENPDWPGNYEVKFWDAGWQKIILDKAVTLAKEGYSGICLDVVDVYNNQDVASAYTGPGTARDAMMAFVGKISDATKAINPDFKLIQNNALDLLTVNPDDPSSATNSAYLSKIDGVNAESTFYLPSNAKTTWGDWNNQYLAHAVDAGKTVFSIDYPSSESAQQDFINKAAAKGYVPFTANQALDNNIDSTNYQVLDKMASAVDHFLAHATGSTGGTTDGGTTPTPTPAPATEPTNYIVDSDAGHSLNGVSYHDEIFGNGGNDTVHGNAGNDYIEGNGGYDTLYGDDGNDVLFGNDGNDKIYGGTGHDYMEGNAGSDYLFGADGNDVLWGGDGSDIIIGGTGDDDLYGNAGADKFSFNVLKGGHDVINDFEGAGAAKGDIIALSSQIYKTVAQVLNNITYEHGDAIIHLDGDNTITVAGVPDHALTADDFQIV